jgi:hypothetical protein
MKNKKLFFLFLVFANVERKKMNNRKQLNEKV